MKITGKAKEHFEEWYPDWIQSQREDYLRFPKEVLLRKFYREIDLMKWGVLQKFFHNSIHFGKEDLQRFWVYSMLEGDSEYYDTREETIKRVIELYNNQPHE